MKKENKFKMHNKTFCDRLKSMHSLIDLSFEIYVLMQHFHTSDQRENPAHKCDISLALEC